MKTHNYTTSWIRKIVISKIISRSGRVILQDNKLLEDYNIKDPEQIIKSKVKVSNIF